jgi:hypothetical protein
MSDNVPDYGSDADAKPASDKLDQLQELVMQMARTKILVDDLETQLKEAKKQLETYELSLVPDLMLEMDMRIYETRGGLRVEYKEDVYASLPKDREKREAAFGYLRDTGNDGLITREFTIAFPRGEDEAAESLRALLVEAQVADHASVADETSVNHQSMLAFLRRQVEAGTISLEQLKFFGAHPIRKAKISVKK